MQVLKPPLRTIYACDYQCALTDILSTNVFTIFQICYLTFAYYVTRKCNPPALYFLQNTFAGADQLYRDIIYSYDCLM